jgi:hypothetical protein
VCGTVVLCTSASAETDSAQCPVRPVMTLPRLFTGVTGPWSVVAFDCLARMPTHPPPNPAASDNDVIRLRTAWDWDCGADVLRPRRSAWLQVTAAENRFSSRGSFCSRLRRTAPCPPSVHPLSDARRSACILIGHTVELTGLLDGDQVLPYPDGVPCDLAVQDLSGGVRALPP